MIKCIQHIFLRIGFTLPVGSRGIIEIFTIVKNIQQKSCTNLTHGLREKSSGIKLRYLHKTFKKCTKECKCGKIEITLFKDIESQHDTLKMHTLNCTQTTPKWDSSRNVIMMGYWTHQNGTVKYSTVDHLWVYAELLECFNPLFNQMKDSLGLKSLFQELLAWPWEQQNNVKRWNMNLQEVSVVSWCKFI